jgi:LPXTG-motif cell wall-anchored protein
MPAVIGGAHNRGGRAAVLCAAALFAAMLVAPMPALGQAALDQYIPRAGPEGTTGSAPSEGGGVGAISGDPTREANAEKAASKPVDDGAAGGSIPVVDYPSTPFLSILAAALGTALLLGLALFVIRRRRHASA